MARRRTRYQRFDETAPAAALRRPDGAFYAYGGIPPPSILVNCDIKKALERRATRASKHRTAFEPEDTA